MIPGLARFQREHPEIDLRVEATSALIDPRTESIDAAVRFGRGQPWPGLCADELAPMVSTLVASPALLEARPIKAPGDLAQHTLLDISGAPDHWSVIAAQSGFRIGRRKSFDSYFATLQAAAHGMGVLVSFQARTPDPTALGRGSTVLKRPCIRELPLPSIRFSSPAARTRSCPAGSRATVSCAGAQPS